MKIDFSGKRLHRGVKFQKGSNKLPYNKGKSVLADTKAGDVVVWDLRTFHSGNSVRLKGFPNFPLHRKIEDLLPSFLTISEPKQRNSVFIVFGADNKHLHRHIEKHYKVKFKKHINALTVVDTGTTEVQNYIKVSNQKTFSIPRAKEFLPAKKSIFNKYSISTHRPY